MDAKQLQRLSFDLARYLDDVLPDLGRHGRRSWAELYLRGLLLDGRRKSAGAMAQRLQRIDRSPQDYEQGLQQFLSQSPWDERPVRDQLAQHLCRALGGEGLLILDDTGFPKQGTHSVGVGRQYSGTLAFAAGSFQYTGDGSGDVRLRIKPAGPQTSGRFHGAIDNIIVRKDEAKK